jgi:hypothetical protein
VLAYDVEKKGIHLGEQLIGGRKEKENIILQTAKLDTNNPRALKEEMENFI